MADLDLSFLQYLGDALWVGSDIRKEIRKGQRGWNWVQRHPKVAWSVAAAIDLMVWPIAAAIAFGMLIAGLGLLAALAIWFFGNSLTA